MGPQPLDNFYRAASDSEQRLAECKECSKRRSRRDYAKGIVARHAYEAARNATPERKAAMAATSKRHRERNPDKYKARNAVNNALRDGRLVRGPCRHCGTMERVQAHHDDYSKPLEVKWECFPCHREHEHGQVVTARTDGRG